MVSALCAPPLNSSVRHLPLKPKWLGKQTENRYILVVRFDWDKQKAASNLSKHKVSFEEAATVFGNPLSDTFDDPDHSADEQRFLIIGHSEKCNK